MCYEEKYGKWPNKMPKKFSKAIKTKPILSELLKKLKLLKETWFGKSVNLKSWISGYSTQLSKESLK